MRKILIIRKNINFSHPSGFNPTFMKKGTYFLCGSPSHHAFQSRHSVKNYIPPKKNIVEGEDTIVVVVSQVDLVTNLSNWVVVVLPGTSMQIEICFSPTRGWRMDKNKCMVIIGKILS